jgi:hypothetical protein
MMVLEGGYDLAIEMPFGLSGTRINSEAVEKLIYESIVMNLQESFFSQRFSGYPDFLSFSYNCIFVASLS